MTIQGRPARALVAGLMVWALGGGTALAVTQYHGVFGSHTVPAAFTSATASHDDGQFIDFDNDGFVLAPHTFTPIPPDHYASQGVTLLNLDARSVGTLPWTGSPPIGAWHTGFSANITTPYSFVFDFPVASFGMFTNDVEGSIAVTVHRSAGNQTFTIPVVTPNDAANMTQFHGYVAATNEILRIDFLSGDYHLIDDVQFAYVPEPAAGILLGLTALGWTLRRKMPR